MKQPCVYILGNRPHGTLYVGVTSDLVARIWQHKNSLADGFTKRYGIHTLLWFEQHGTMESAILREKQLKAGSRMKKIALIEAANPEWQDLYSGILSV